MVRLAERPSAVAVTVTLSFLPLRSSERPLPVNLTLTFPEALRPEPIVTVLLRTRALALTAQVLVASHSTVNVPCLTVVFLGTVRTTGAPGSPGGFAGGRS